MTPVSLRCSRSGAAPRHPHRSPQRARDQPVVEPAKGWPLEGPFRRTSHADDSGGDYWIRRVVASKARTALERPWAAYLERRSQPRREQLGVLPHREVAAPVGVVELDRVLEAQRRQRRDARVVREASDGSRMGFVFNTFVVMRITSCC